MIIATRKWGVIENTYWLIGLFGLVYLTIALVGLSDYIPWTSVNFILGMAGLPLTIHNSSGKPVSKIFFLFAVILGISSFILPIKIMLFISLCAALLSIAEGFLGNISALSFLTLAFMSPAIQYLAGIFSFPIRLSLTSFAGKLLKLTGTESSVAGNVITFGSHDYSVDPACMGLKMMLTSLLCGIFIIAMTQKKHQKYLRWTGITLSLTIVFALNLIANMIRILVLVYFDIRPENKMHEVTGLICLAIYVLLPSLWIIQLLIKKWGIKAVSLPIASLPTPKTSRFLLKHISLALLLAFSSIYICRKNNRPIPHSLPQVSGYIGAFYDSDVIQYRNASALVYIKKINGVFSAEHNPAMCWLGSGFIFESIDQASFQGVAVYTGILKKGNERLYTAWWFDNGLNRTLGQLDWRWEVLKGSKPYSVVNVTAADKRLLNEEIYKIISRGIFKPAL